MPEPYVPPSPSSSSLAAVDQASVSWRAIFAGLFVSFLCYLLLASLGLGVAGAGLVGVISGGSQGEGAGSTLSIGSGIWIALSALLSLFAGGYAAARVSGLIPSRIGGVQGLVIASIFFLFALSQIGSTIGFIGKGLGSTLGAAGDLSSNPQVQSIAESALGKLNLKAPPQEVARELATRLARGDDQGAKSYLAQQAGISPREADRRLQGVKSQVQATLRDVGEKAARAASAVGWTLFAVILLGSLAALAGGSSGAKRNLRRPLSEKDLRAYQRKAA